MQQGPSTRLHAPADTAADRVLVIPWSSSGSPGDGRFLRALSREGCAAAVLPAGPAALEALERDPCLLVFLELPAQAAAGLEFLRRLRDRLPGLRVVVLSDAPCLETVVEALRLGAFDFVENPVTPAALQAVLRRARAAGDPRQDVWLESLRALAPGLVHELRNPLSSVLASGQLLGRLVAPHDPARKYADIIIEEARQLEGFLARIAEFGRLEPGAAPAAAELPALLEGVCARPPPPVRRGVSACSRAATRGYPRRAPMRCVWPRPAPRSCGTPWRPCPWAGPSRCARAPRPRAAASRLSSPTPARA